MSSQRKDLPEVLHALPGRLRVRLPGDPEHVEARLRELPGVTEAMVNRLTGNALIRYACQQTSEECLRQSLAELQAALLAAEVRAEAERPSASSALVRVGVCGVVGHGLVDTVLYTVAFTEPFGLPLAGLGALHLFLDTFVWTATLLLVVVGLTRPRQQPALAMTPSRG
jgi:hypothetical protein